MNEEMNELQKWLENSPSIAQNLVLSDAASQPTTRARNNFQSQRDTTHNKMSNKLNDYLSKLNTKKDKYILAFAEKSQYSSLKVGKNLKYDDMNLNLSVRKLVFVGRMIQEIEVEKLNTQLNHCLQLIDQSQKILGLYDKEKNIIPNDTMLTVKENFFNFKDSETLSKLNEQHERLRIYYLDLQEKIKKYPIPKWVTEFDGFLIDCIHKSLQHFDTGLSYSRPFPYEVSLSRGIFQVKSFRAKYIDNFLCNITKMQVAEFTQNILKISADLLSDGDKLNPNEQSVGLMFFFRIIYDRMYEKYSKHMFVQDDTNYQEKLFALSKISVGKFNIPQTFKDAKSEMSIREYFRKNHFLYSSSLFMNEIIYITNPIDSLYWIHRALLGIHKAGLLSELGDRSEATSEDLNHLLSFDDLFSLLVGVVLASDLPDVQMLFNFIIQFTPRYCLSNSFEYAQAGITALMMHFQEVDLNNVTAPPKGLPLPPPHF